ncbi:MAG: hypothetical protein PHU99_10340 [Candidatus Cloacimonetes bacterium]|nr:hypothetical protein [Candidatus Cloacimonadota bacterium]MCK9334361.1 hypothetical protein [Candidatus Cloacimonadota bacterium]MDD2683139.1 hypothetical protein [Candidatus Cloacimonadota bacterium]MDD3098105.1 hypothetical protein [Candidatus Cloacimonadota bacterium]
MQKTWLPAVNLEDRASDICRVLATQEKINPLNVAIELMDRLMALDNNFSTSSDQVIAICRFQ